jgi:hypothetical protein
VTAAAGPGDRDQVRKSAFALDAKNHRQGKAQSLVSGGTGLDLRTIASAAWSPEPLTTVADSTWPFRRSYDHFGFGLVNFTSRLKLN